jgi:hypothetical protein
VPTRCNNKEKSVNIQRISSGAEANHNEDLVAIFEHPGCTDIVVMDGASSVADEDYIDRELGDVVWFVRQFAAALGEVADPGVDQQESVMLACARVRQRYDDLALASKMPLYASPLAAMTWVRVTEGGEGARLDVYCLGDCKALLLVPGQGAVDLDPWVNPQESILQGAIAKLAEEGVVDAEERRLRLLPMLRARREEQNLATPPIGLCLAPRAPFLARRYLAHAQPGSMLLVMTDGFSRIVDTYGLCTMEQLAARCLQGELPTLLQELRDFERLGSDTRTVKRADDASAVTLRL